MSYSTCLNCGDMVSGYEKYCPDCIGKFNLPNEPNFQKTSWVTGSGFDAYDKSRMKIVVEDMSEAIQKLKLKDGLFKYNK